MPNALDLLYAAGLVAASPVLAYRLLRTGKWRTDWQGRFGRAEALGHDPRPTVLLHGVSVGEVAAAEPLVAGLGGREGRGPCRVVLSVTTDTGFARATSLYGAHHRVVRYPLDFSSAVERFLDRIRPDVVGLLELEVWPNFTRACQDRGIPVVVLNGRLSADSFRGYERLRRALAPSFKRLSGVSAQTLAYADRFEALGVPRGRIEVADSMKWDVPVSDDIVASGAALARAMGIDPARPTVVAVSTGPDEEALLLADRPPEVQLVVVPRKPERFEAVAALAGWRRRSLGSLGSDPGPETEPHQGPAEAGGAATEAGLFLVDTMGEAEAATALADVVVIGRSFNGMGGSNPVPAARLGKPIVVGPDHGNFADMVDALVDGGAAVVEATPWPAVAGILDDPSRRAAMSAAGPRVVEERSGATEANLALIRRNLPRADGRSARLPPAGTPSAPP